MKELGGTNGLSRRDFLRSGLVFGVGAQALASGYAAVPDVFARAVLSAKNAAIQNDKVLVMIQLGGGNDGLQTVIPISSSQYRDFRPQLSAAAAKAQPISGDLGLHENLKGIKTLFDAAMSTVRDTVAQLRTSSAKYTPKGNYSDKVQLVYSSKNQLAAALQLAAELIVTGTGVKVLHVTLGGFDTHYTELNRHDALMAYLDSAISAFHDDLTAYGMAARVMIATWSELGRRPKENASGGTDHGTASPVFLIGDGVKGGLYGETPSLAKLDQLGNLSYSVDFRAVYQEILASHLGVDAREILGQSFDRVPFVKAPA